MSDSADMAVEWVARNFDGVSRTVQESAGDGLFAAATHLRGESNKTVPIEEGTLQRSGGVDVDRRAGEATAYYDTPYAAAVHEDTTAQRDPGRRAKWLELTAAERNREIVELIAAGIRRALS